MNDVIAWAIFALCLSGFALAWMGTFAMRRIAPRIGFVDKPGHRKIHRAPIPLGGGVAIFLAFALPILAVVVVASQLGDARAISGLGSIASKIDPAYWGGVRQQSPLALSLVAAMAAMHVMGLRDDRRALGPYGKLLFQLAVTAALVIPFKSLWMLTALDDRLHLNGVLSVTLSVLWITAITNAFNFLDNMDGLSAGVAAVATAAFLVATLSIGQLFVAAALAILLGALLGFLCFNFAPASIFMGDSGSLVVGFALGVLTIRTTYLTPGVSWGAGWYAVLAPVIVLAVPLYDLLVVSAIRLSRGKSPFVGDTNHFSHRLVARGMSKRTAVLCLYLVTAATSVAAVILPHVDSPFAAKLIFGQTLLILGVVMLLEQHPLPTPKDDVDSRVAGVSSQVPTALQSPAVPPPGQSL